MADSLAMPVFVIPLMLDADDGKGFGYSDAGLPLDHMTLILPAWTKLSRS